MVILVLKFNDNPRKKEKNFPSAEVEQALKIVLSDQKPKTNYLKKKCSEGRLIC